jgi:hypothetical protein
MKDDKVVEKYTFRYTFGDYDDVDRLDNCLEFSTEGSTVTELLGKFEQFLRGAGFTFTGEFEVVDHNNFKIVPRSRVEVTSSFEQGLNITNEGNVYPPGQEQRSPDRGPYSTYPDEGIDAWHRGKTDV